MTPEKPIYLHESLFVCSFLQNPGEGTISGFFFSKVFWRSQFLHLPYNILRLE